MSDLISRRDAIELLSDLRAECNIFSDEEEAKMYYVLSWAIQEMKTEQETGHWIKQGDTFFCSECGAGFDKYNLLYFKYCPNCGAKMDGERKEDNE